MRQGFVGQQLRDVERELARKRVTFERVKGGIKVPMLSLVLITDETGKIVTEERRA